MTRSSTSPRLALAGLASLGAAAVCGEAALVHMRWMALAYGQLCGAGGIAHCPACPAAAGFTALGLALLAYGRRRLACVTTERD